MPDEMTEATTMDTKAVAEIAAAACALEDDDLNTFIENFVGSLAPDQITNVVVRAMEGREVFGKIIAAIESRFAAEFGNNDFSWSDERSGKKYEWSARAYRKCDDPVGLYAELTERGIPAAEILRAVKADGLRITDLRRAAKTIKDEITREQTLADIDSFLAWKPSGRRIRERGEED